MGRAAAARAEGRRPAPPPSPSLRSVLKSSCVLIVKRPRAAIREMFLSRSLRAQSGSSGDVGGLLVQALTLTEGAWRSTRRGEVEYKGTGLQEGGERGEDVR
jgi:hypothetical protein